MEGNWVLKVNTKQKMPYDLYRLLHRKSTKYRNNYCFNNYVEKPKRTIKKINISKLTKKQNQLIYKTKELLENLVNKKITEDKYLLQMNEINKRLTNINEQINSFNIQNDLKDKNIENIKKFIEYLKTHPITDNKLDFIRLLVSKVIITSNEQKQKKFTIMYNFEI